MHQIGHYILPGIACVMIILIPPPNHQIIYFRDLDLNQSYCIMQFKKLKLIYTTFSKYSQIY